VVEEERGENEVMQPANATVNAAANALANPVANAPANAPANAANNAANAANIQGNPAPNPRRNAGAQPAPVQADRSEGSRRHRIRDEVEIARRANYDREHGVPDALDANNPIQATGHSDPSIWLKMYNIASCASGGNEDHMAGYFPLVMGKAPLLWLDNLPAECITSWATLSRLFTTNYQATCNRPSNTHHLARVWMRSDETLREYTNRYFENRNTLAGVKDDDVIGYYKKGITNIKLFEKIHEADAKTIGDLMGYVDKLVDTQDAVMHNFNAEDHDDRGTRSRKRSGEAYVTDPPRPSTFLEGDFNMVMDDHDAKHTMRECKQLKRALGVPSTSKKTRSNNNDDRSGGQRFDNRNRRPDRRDYCGRRPYP
jgi:hypothetical protein